MITQKTSVLIIGSGGAGLRTAIELHDAGIECLIVGKCKQREAHTKWAQGGINAALGTMDPEDSWQQHAADTIQDGGMINDPIAVELLCKHAGDAIHELDSWGTDFAKEEDGRITQRFFGAARYRRACFVGAHTGLAILNTLVDQVLTRKIPFKSEVYITSLLMRDGVVNGALGFDLQTGEIITIHSKAVVLATGGHSRVFARSSSHFWENNADGIKLALDCGASFKDMEMFQFHPTGMVYPEEVSGTLVTEATRGEGGILRNAKGERFMEKYAPERLELSARDVVARANWQEIVEGRGTEHGGVYLDISHKPKDYILERLPDIYEQLLEWNKIDISKEPMEVAPTAHYSMGGISVNPSNGQTGIENLYAVGEVGSGVHGGNRLGGNSLAEILVFGKLTGQHLVSVLSKTEFVDLDEDLLERNKKDLTSLAQGDSGEDPMEFKKEIQSIMWEHCGVIRDKASIEEGLAKIKNLQKKELNVQSELGRSEKLLAALDSQNMLPTCEMILLSALAREESRAAHFRSDLPETKEQWRVNIVCHPSDDGFIVQSSEIQDVPEEIAQFFAHQTDAVHLLE